MFINKIHSSTVLITVLLFLILTLVNACTTDQEKSPVPEEPQLPFKGFAAPAHFPVPVYTFKNNEVTQEGFELGRDLFYDPILSKDNTISCGTCHKQFAAFADYQHPFSHGIRDQLTTRNSPGIFNMAWNSAFMWDGGINHIEVMPIAPITNPVEMNEDLANVVDKLRNHPTYPQKFKKAFGIDNITSKEILLAFAQFMGAMVSSNSRYDKYIVNPSEYPLTENELAGLNLFNTKCGSCHSGVLQTDQSYRNNGLDNNFTRDEGRYLITNVESDLGKFRVPSLRNVYLTTPYMHDGRFATLEQVLDHYRSQIKMSSTLDPSLINQIKMTDKEKEQIIAYLKTLTDYEFTTDKRFKEPIR